MSGNEDAEKQVRKREKIDHSMNFSKQKKRKRKTTDQTEDKVESINSQDQSDEIEGDEVKTEPKKPSKRQLKREKVEKKYADQREASKLEAAQKALTYISKWKHAKSDWKFEKLRQIWLMDHLLDEDLVPDSIFPIALEYFEGCKGMARQQLVKKMMDVIKKVEELNENEKTDESEDNDPTITAEYQRARQILQALPTEG